MLPDDGDWLGDGDDDDDDSDEPNYGGTTNGLETESIHNEDSVVETPSSPSQQQSRPSRYGTYFHHPERAATRRRQSVPGAFPAS